MVDGMFYFLLDSVQPQALAAHGQQIYSHFMLWQHYGLQKIYLFYLSVFLLLLLWTSGLQIWLNSVESILSVFPV